MLGATRVLGGVDRILGADVRVLDAVGHGASGGHARKAALADLSKQLAQGRRELEEGLSLLRKP